MSWLDFGWLRNGDHWEYHPWGPWTPGYRVSSVLQPEVARKIRWMRMGILLLAALAAVGSAMVGNWWPMAGVTALGSIIEIGFTCYATKGLPRTDRPLGTERGMLYLAQWLGPKCLWLARGVTVLLLAMTVILLWWEPRLWSGYVLLVVFVGLLFVLSYMDLLQRSAVGGKK